MWLLPVIPQLLQQDETSIFLGIRDNKGWDSLIPGVPAGWDQLGAMCSAEAEWEVDLVWVGSVKPQLRIGFAAFLSSV